jgi:hypothetical protein
MPIRKVNVRAKKLETKLPAAVQYDSLDDTLRHIHRVQELLAIMQAELAKRAIRHDFTKLLHPEKPVFDKHTPKLKSSTYGSKEYVAFLKTLAPALKHHYSCHRHHPQYHKHGVADMNLVDLIEMICDWKASSERHANGNLSASIKTNRKRFKLHRVSVLTILENTRSVMGWV